MLTTPPLHTYQPTDLGEVMAAANQLLLGEELLPIVFQSQYMVNGVAYDDDTLCLPVPSSAANDKSLDEIG